MNRYCTKAKRAEHSGISTTAHAAGGLRLVGTMKGDPPGVLNTDDEEWHGEFYVPGGDGKLYTSKRARRLLQGRNMVVMGDSPARRLAARLVILLLNPLEDPLKAETNKLLNAAAHSGVEYTKNLKDLPMKKLAFRWQSTPREVYDSACERIGVGWGRGQFFAWNDTEIVVLAQSVQHLLGDFTAEHIIRYDAPQMVDSALCLCERLPSTGVVVIRLEPPMYDKTGLHNVSRENGLFKLWNRLVRVGLGAALSASANGTRPRRCPANKIRIYDFERTIERHNQGRAWLTPIDYSFCPEAYFVEKMSNETKKYCKPNPYHYNNLATQVDVQLMLQTIANDFPS